MRVADNNILQKIDQYIEENREQMMEFARIHKELRIASDAKAAEAVIKVIAAG